MNVYILTPVFATILTGGRRVLQELVKRLTHGFGPMIEREGGDGGGRGKSVA